MNAVTTPEAVALKPTGLALLREPVPLHLISPLPKPTKAQNDESTKHMWIRCQLCAGWHHPQVTHLSYVGHAAATHLLLDADPNWQWEPVAWTPEGLPCFDKSGGLWIKLTVCGVTRLGYGHAKAKPTADEGAREKEVIGDAIRNAAMRFGLALELWSKADIHAEDGDDDTDAIKAAKRTQWIAQQKALIAAAANVGELKKVLAKAIEQCQLNEDMEAELELREAAAAKQPQSKGK